MPIISFEGIDRSGKTTQVRLLAETLKLEGHSILLKKFPDYSTPSGQLILKYLNHELNFSTEELTLIFITDFARSAKEITEFAKTGIVLLDRYFMSTMAYQGYLGINFMHILQIIKNLKLPIPDLTFFFKLPLDELKNRFRDKLDRHETDFDLIQGVAHKYQQLYNALPVQRVQTVFVEVDASNPIEVITDRLLASIKKDVDLA